MRKPGRPVLRWHGGKWLLAPWIIEHFPPHRVYVEPFGGAASVLIRKPRSYAEVYNDLDDDVVNLFQVLRGPRGGDLVHSVIHTPFSRTEFKRAYEETDDPVERARFLRASSNRSGTTPAHDWVNYPDHLERIIARLEGVVVENRPAVEVMLACDSPDTLHYVDPPYVHATRSKAHNSQRKNYRHELTDADHVQLLEVLRGLKGSVVLSGYPHPVYDTALAGWHRVEREALADGARKRVEVLWRNPKAAAETLNQTADIFGAAA